MDPLVSIIIPAYNRSALLERAVSSAANQSYKNIEIIVIDDGSEEDIESGIIKHRKSSPFPIHYHKQQNAGPGAARKAGLERSNGDFIQYLDSDDSISPEKIQRQVESLLADSTAFVSISSWEYSTGQYQKLTPAKKINNPKDLLYYALNSRPWPTSAPLWQYPSKNIPYWPPLMSGEDIVHDVSVGVVNQRITWLQEPLTQIYRVDSSISKASLVPSKRARRYRDNFAYPFECFSLVQNAGLLKDGYYSEQLSERCFRIGFQFAVVGEKEYAQKLIKKAVEASTNPVKIFECMLALFVLNARDTKYSGIYQFLFKVHRILNPYSIHAGKGINTLNRV